MGSVECEWKRDPLAHSDQKISPSFIHHSELCRKLHQETSRKQQPKIRETLIATQDGDGDFIFLFQRALQA